MKRLSVALMFLITFFYLPFPPETQNNPVQVQNPTYSIFLPVIQGKSPRAVFPFKSVDPGWGRHRVPAVPSSRSE